MSAHSLVEQLKGGLDAPICLTWELTYACNLQCVHCLSSSGRRDPRELTTDEATAVLDELRDLQVFYINIGGGEPMIRRDFFELIEHAIHNGIGVKFSTNGTFIDTVAAQRLASMDYLDIQISLDGTDAVTNDAVRGDGSTPPHVERWTTSAMPVSGRSRSPSSSPVTTSTSSTSSRRLPILTGRNCESRGCDRQAVAPTPGTNCTRPTPSNARSTSGCSPTATTC